MRLTPLSTPAYTSPRLASHQASSPSVQASKPDAFTPSTSSLRLQRQGFTVEGIRAEILPALEKRIQDLETYLQDNEKMTFREMQQATLVVLQNTQNKINTTIAGKKATDLVRIEGLQLLGLDLTGANLTDAYLRGANLSGAKLIKANLTNAILENVNLHDADLTEANFYKANLTNAILTEACLRQTNLTKAFLAQANLTEAHCYKADLTEANFYNANLTNAFLAEANLTNAFLGKANLTEAYLRGANLTETDLRQAILTRARLMYVQGVPINLNTTQLKTAAGYPRDLFDAIDRSQRN